MGRVQLLDTYIGNSYNIFSAEVAQSVEQRAEIAPRVHIFIIHAVAED